MISNQDIHDLIRLPKKIVTKEPARGFRHADQHMRCNVELRAAASGTNTFEVFARRHSRFIENFSIGLRYQTSERTVGHITLVRYNGAHGEYSLAPDRHFALPHVHRITEDEIASGYTQPQERAREVTDRYSTFEQALLTFFEDTATINFEDYFENLRQARLIP